MCITFKYFKGEIQKTEGYKKMKITVTNLDINSIEGECH